MQLKTTLIGTGTLALAASLILGRVARAIPTTASGKRGSKGVLELVISPNSSAVHRWGDTISLVG